jgi:phage host-nuclease inhibitor protein Gam
MLEEHEVMNMLIDDELGRDEDGNNITYDNSVGWHITNDMLADWAIEKVASIDSDYRRKEMIAKNKIAQIEEWLTREKAQADKERNYFEVRLKEYFESLPESAIKATKTQKSYKLPSGVLKLKQKNPEIIRNDDALLQWVKQNKPRFIKIKESVDWAGLKELTQIAGDKIVDIQTGEIIDGVYVEQRDPEFIIEVK